MKTIKLDIQSRNVWFTSDTHFHHANIVKYCDRPFGHVKTMDSAIIQNWNNVVEPNDDVIIGGDFCWGRKDSWVWLLHTLNGNKYLAPGNHDKTAMIPNDLFVKVSPLLNVMITGDEEIDDGQRIVVCHYPMITWNHSHRGSWQLFGHVHSRNNNTNREQGRLRCLTPNQYDIGVDNNDFTPVSYQQIKEIITKQNLR